MHTRDKTRRVVCMCVAPVSLTPPPCMCVCVAHSLSLAAAAAARARLFSLFSRPAKTRREINFCPRARLHCAEIMPAQGHERR
jgi:hypothetical protein